MMEYSSYSPHFMGIVLKIITWSKSTLVNKTKSVKNIKDILNCHISPTLYLSSSFFLSLSFTRHCKNFSLSIIYNALFYFFSSLCYLIGPVSWVSITFTRLSLRITETYKSAFVFCCFFFKQRLKLTRHSSVLGNRFHE